MKSPQFIRKVVSVPLYLAVLCYMLPFRPGYVYCISRYKPIDILNEIKKENGDPNGYAGSSSKSISQSDASFWGKHRSKFYFSGGFTITAVVSNPFIIFSKDEIRSFLLSSYQPPLVFFILNRGPPVIG